MPRTQPSHSDHIKSRRLTEQARPSKRWRKYKRRKFFGRIQDICWGVLIAPIKLLFVPANLIELFYFRGHKTGRRRVKSVPQRIKYGLKESLRLPYRLISKGFKRRNLKDLLFLLPAVATGGLVCFVGFQLSVQSQRIQDRYNSGARQALLSGNLDLASTYFRRIIDRSSLSAPQSLQWVTVLRAAGENDPADRLLAQLAPDDKQGYPAAHAMRAIELAKSIDSQWAFGNRNVGQEVNLDITWIPSPDSDKVDQAIKQLKTHLQNANEDDPRIHLAWAKYWLCQRDIDAACKRIKLATKSHHLVTEAVHFIDRHLSTEHLEQQEWQQLDKAKNSLLNNAREMLEGKLKVNPLDHLARIQLAATLVNQGNYDLARGCLRQGIAFQPNPSLQRGLADVFVLEYQSKPSAETQRSIQSTKELFRNRVGKLKAAIEADPSYLLPYACFAKLLCEQADSADNTDSSISRTQTKVSEQQVDLFQRLVTSDRPSPLDHIGLASLYWRQGNRDLADWHLDQAWLLDPLVGEKAHRLATAYVFFSGTPDLPWARNLVDRALLKCPNASEVLLSQGRILLEQGEVELAVQQLNRSLVEAKFPEEVHNALEIGYVRLGNLELAYKHSSLAKSARARQIILDWK